MGSFYACDLRQGNVDGTEHFVQHCMTRVRTFARTFSHEMCLFLHRFVGINLFPSSESSANMCCFKTFPATPKLQRENLANDATL